MLNVLINQSVTYCLKCFDSWFDATKAFGLRPVKCYAFPTVKVKVKVNVDLYSTSS